MTAQTRTPLDTWRKLACRFYSIRILVEDGYLPDDFEPGHLAHLIEKGPVTYTTHNVCRFLLHVWNPTAHPFDLSDTFSWNHDQLAVVAAWATGEATGEPGHYF